MLLNHWKEEKSNKGIDEEPLILWLMSRQMFCKVNRLADAIKGFHPSLVYKKRVSEAYRYLNGAGHCRRWEIDFKKIILDY